MIFQQTNTFHSSFIARDRSVIQSLFYGFSGFLRGFYWIAKRPKLWLLLMVPWCLGLVGLFVGIALISMYGPVISTKLLMTWFSSWEPGVTWHLIYAVSRGAIWVSLFILCMVAAALLVSIISAPVYDFLSVKVERDLIGGQVTEIPWRRYPMVMLTEAAKAAIILVLPVVLLIIPGVNVLAGVAVAFLMGWDFMDYPLSRRGWSLGQRLKFVTGDFFIVLGFGIWLAIPYLVFIFAPVAVVGGTMLCVETMERRKVQEQKK
jgi:CysZ protein